MPHQNGPKAADERRRVLVVGAGAAGMSAAHHLAQRADKFAVTLIDAADRCGGQAFSIPLGRPPRHYGASWCNQGVQGGSRAFHHTLAMFARAGYHADPVALQASFGKDGTFWTNVFPTVRTARHSKEAARLAAVLGLMRWLGVFFALLPLRLVFRLLLFSDEFVDVVVLPMTALFLGTGNATPGVPFGMFERLCSSPTYGMWYKTDRNTVVSNKPPMVVFPNLSEFYETWREDLVSRGVSVRLSTELTEVVQRDKHGVVVRLKSRGLVPDHHNHNDVESGAVTSQEHFDEIILCCLADKAKEVLGRTASWREKRVLGSAKFSDDITITHNDAEYMKKHYENFYREDLAVAKTNGVDQTSRLRDAAANFRPMYYIKMYEEDKSKLEMSFDTTNYQSQFPEKVTFEQHVFQTIYLNKDRDRHLWSDGEIRKDRIIRQDWWHQLCHSYTHYLFVVPWMMFLQAHNHTRFAGSWTLVNAHEVAIISGIAAAVDLGAEYPEDLEHDQFSFLCFRLYYLLAYGKWYRRNYTARRRRTEPASQAAKDGSSWATGLHGSVYNGPGVSTVERQTWREEVEKGTSTENLAKENAPGRSQP
ncbi:FAD/NAD(P)-binding domain-containing protein [Nemania diffusa]|nr:FAD/NAD(P)-binding domain-containing protein [Nemania diffusa]